MSRDGYSRSKSPRFRWTTGQVKSRTGGGIIVIGVKIKTCNASKVPMMAASRDSAGNWAGQTVGIVYPKPRAFPVETSKRDVFALSATFPIQFKKLRGQNLFNIAHSGLLCAPCNQHLHARSHPPTNLPIAGMQTAYLITI